MKKLIYPIIIIVFASCGGKKENVQTEEFASEADKPKASSATQIAEGEALIKASDCKTCHHATNKIIGPAHLDVAKKYDFTEANVKLLAGRIITGVETGKGVWGEIPMTAHVGMTQVDAEKMARYVLSLDGETEH
jgi:cytochrome c